MCGGGSGDWNGHGADGWQAEAAADFSGGASGWASGSGCGESSGAGTISTSGSRIQTPSSGLPTPHGVFGAAGSRSVHQEHVPSSSSACPNIVQGAHMDGREAAGEEQVDDRDGEEASAVHLDTQLGATVGCEPLPSGNEFLSAENEDDAASADDICGTAGTGGTDEVVARNKKPTRRAGRRARHRLRGGSSGSQGAEKPEASLESGSANASAAASLDATVSGGTQRHSFYPPVATRDSQDSQAPVRRGGRPPKKSALAARTAPVLAATPDTFGLGLGPAPSPLCSSGAGAGSVIADDGGEGTAGRSAIVDDVLGKHVLLVGLVKASEFNGKWGRVESYDADLGRFVVSVIRESGPPVMAKLRRENLIVSPASAYMGTVPFSDDVPQGEESQATNDEVDRHHVVETASPAPMRHANIAASAVSSADECRRGSADRAPHRSFDEDFTGAAAQAVGLDAEGGVARAPGLTIAAVGEGPSTSLGNPLPAAATERWRPTLRHWWGEGC
eukprot:gnl/TRDRNA2_/TRDRNA2_172885_c0_seq3.p1 gnl/TRDRNA2_/TRDRNA2_172885_c0~~gnl/TRDRNA2_/TRDRNA2_172885_c0_seq3.p1  ORF type:complete len:563 (+),score=108.03 gnl/TRDRNA2_/TRDRNA2_172885_c0_seq3:179-1690(+)